MPETVNTLENESQKPYRALLYYKYVKVPEHEAYAARHLAFKHCPCGAYFELAHLPGATN